MLRLDKFTHKSQEAVQNALQLAEELGHQQIDAEHLSFSLLKDKEGVVPAILTQLSVSPEELTEKLEAELKKKPQVEGSGQPFLSQPLNKILGEAQKIAASMKDEYVSQEHILLAL